MTIKLNVLNYSQKTSDYFIESCINGFLDELINEGINIRDVQIEYNDDFQYKMVKQFIDENPKYKPLIDNDGLMIRLNDYHGRGDRFIITGEELPTQNPWGDAIEDFITVIKNLSEKNIWHEIAHVIGAEDHYDPITKKPIKKCSHDNCIMRYGKEDGVLCECSIEEIKTYLK